MANKNCTPSLIGKKRKNTSFFRTLFKKQSDNGFYTAVSHDGATTLWWIEANQLGKTSCYPCVLCQNGEEHAFVSGLSNKEKASNKQLVEKWKEAVSPETIEQLYTISELTPEDFFREFNSAEDRQMARLFSTRKKEEEADQENDGEIEEQKDGGEVETNKQDENEPCGL